MKAFEKMQVKSTRKRQTVKNREGAKGTFFEK
jgi:hypothetical protein